MSIPTDKRFNPTYHQQLTAVELVARVKQAFPLRVREEPPVFKFFTYQGSYYFTANNVGAVWHENLLTWEYIGYLLNH